MNRFLVTALATAALGIAASPASAAATLQQCTSGASCVSGTTNVNLLAYPSTGSLIVSGTVGTQVGAPVVNFTSTNGLLDTNPGAATVFRASSNAGLLTQLTFTLLTGSFTAAEFNLERGALTGTAPLSITLTALGGGTRTFDVTNSTGSNIFDIIAGLPGESYTSASFSTTGGGFDDLKQLRLVLAAPTAAVPEPATWAMMLVGFGGIGLTLRRRRRNASMLKVA